MATSPAPPATFEPVPLRRRRDGWTVERQDAFLQALAACGCVSHACRAVGMSRETAYALYNHPKAKGFRRAWDAALDCALRLVEDGIWSRAIHGVARPIFFQGEQVGEYRHYDERLSLFLLRYRRPHRFAEPLKLIPEPPIPGWEDQGTDPDEPIGALDFHRDDLEEFDDEARESASIDGVSFVSFQPTGEVTE